ncbi:MAG TPA: CPBP family intramembrane glutamic endopeptidase [Candidatus Acidoferrum sp.]|nr:CPBP family intramembrane glutamic endopeptidase [Candidatus Acidoferrum sp.]
MFWITFSFGLDLLAIELFGFPPTSISVQRVLREDVLSFLAAFGAALAMAKLERRDVDVYGLPRKRAFGKLFWQGCFLGLVEVSVLLGSIAALGGYSFGSVALHGQEIARWGGLWFVAFVAVGLSEEFLFRGYTQYTLARGIGFWPAAILLSVLFGAGHLWNPGESYVGAAGVTATGLVFAFTLRRTGNLWLAVGWHAAFDFGETFLYSVPDSGMLFEHHLSNASLHGATWLTGGTVGPEGSVFSFLTMGIMAMAVHFLFPGKGIVEETKQEGVPPGILHE